MNVQDVIEKALAGNDGIPVTPVEHSSCDDVQIEKLASALNFIGANLESTFDELEKAAAKNKSKKKTQNPPGTRAKRRKKTTPKVDAPAPKKVSPSFMDLHGKKLKYGGGALAAGGLVYGLHKYRNRNKDQQKAASVDDVLYHAAQAGKQALLEKVAEDRINPARIVAGPADPYSGEIMPNAGNVSNEFVGNTRDHHALIQLKAQKVRDRINKDMKQFVNNVGDGYNLQGHLTKFNK